MSTGPQQPPGWYEDPWEPGNRRWWDGQSWSQHTTPHAAPQAAPQAPTHAAGRQAGGRRKWPFVVGGLLALLAIAAVAVVLLVVVGGGDDDEVATPGPSTSSTPSEPKPPPADAEAGSNKLPEGSLGERFSMITQEGNRVAVTAVSVEDPVARGSYVLKPDRGKRWVGVKLRVEALGPGAYDDSVGNASQLTAGGKRLKSDSSEPEGCPSFPATTNLAEGSTETKCVIFQVPTGDEPTELTYSPSSRFSPDLATWRLEP